METEVEQPSKLRKCFKCFAIATWSVFGALVLLFAAVSDIRRGG